jgi:DNA-binding HxlR family transcriptional regulator
LVVVERAGSRVDRVSNSLELSAVGTGGGAKFPKGRKGGRRASKYGVEVPARVCQAMFALGHVQRMKIIRKLLDGPATYQALKRLTKLKPGPLYHHVNQLRLAGLILPRQRDLYELTRAGRNMVLAMLVLAPLTHDSRRRPSA